MFVVWEGREIEHMSCVMNVIETGSALWTNSSCKGVTDLLCIQRKVNNLCELFSLLTSERSFPAGGQSASWFAGDTFKVVRSLRFVMHLSVAGNEGGKSFTWLARPIRPAKDNKAHSGLRRCVKYPHRLSLSHTHIFALFLFYCSEMKVKMSAEQTERARPRAQEAGCAGSRQFSGLTPFGSVRRLTTGRHRHSVPLRGVKVRLIPDQAVTHNHRGKLWALLARVFWQYEVLRWEKAWMNNRCIRKKERDSAVGFVIWIWAL